jgi:hypothetical protein
LKKSNRADKKADVRQEEAKRRTEIRRWRTAGEDKQAKRQQGRYTGRETKALFNPKTSSLNHHGHQDRKRRWRRRREMIGEDDKQKSGWAAPGLGRWRGATWEEEKQMRRRGST